MPSEAFPVGIKLRCRPYLQRCMSYAYAYVRDQARPNVFQLGYENAENMKCKHCALLTYSSWFAMTSCSQPQPALAAFPGFQTDHSGIDAYSCDAQPANLQLSWLHSPTYVCSMCTLFPTGTLDLIACTALTSSECRENRLTGVDLIDVLHSTSEP